MLPAYWLLVLFVLACPVYAVLHAVSLVFPFYLVLLGLGFGMLYALWRRSAQRWRTLSHWGQFELEEILTLLSLILGFTCAIAGFVFAPLPVRLLVAIALASLWNRTAVTPNQV